MQTWTNVFTVLCGIVAIYYSFAIWRLVRARAILLFALVITYQTLLRFAVTCDQVHEKGWVSAHTSYLLIPFWPIFALAMFLMYRALRRSLDEL